MKKRMFQGESIVKETIALGIAGQIERGDGFPELPKRSRVRFEAEADYENVKHKFLEKGGVEETLILTIDRESFEVLEVSEKPKQEELPAMDAEAKGKLDEAVEQATSNDPEPATV